MASTWLGWIDKKSGEKQTLQLNGLWNDDMNLQEQQTPHQWSCSQRQWVPATRQCRHHIIYRTRIAPAFRRPE
jgi:hypothetical protein